MNLKCKVDMNTKIIFDFLFQNMIQSPVGLIMQVGTLGLLIVYVITGQYLYVTLAGILAFYLIFGQMMQAYKQKRLTPAFQQPIWYEFTEKGIIMTIQGKKEQASWDQIYLVNKSFQSYFFYTNEKNALIVPKKSLEGKDERLKKLVYGKVSRAKIRRL